MGSNLWRADGIRVEIFSRIHHIWNSQWDSEYDGRIKVWTWAISRKDHLHVHVQWHCMVNSKKWRQLCGDFFECCNTCQKVSIRMWVILGNLVVRRSGMELTSTSQMVNGTELPKSWRSISLKAVIPYFRPPAQRKWRKRWIDSSHNHFCQSAQYLRRSRRFVQWTHNRHRETCCKIISKKNRRTSWRPGIVKTVQRCWFLEEDREGTVLHYNWRRIWDYMQTRDLETSRPRGWILSNTNIGPVLDVKIYPHEGRCCSDIMIESLFRDQTASWIRIVNGINKYVTETSQEIQIENLDSSFSTEKVVAKAKPRPRSVVNSNVNVPFLERKWIDIDPEPFDRCCFEVSKFMTRTLRHDESIPREEDGAVRFDDLITKFKEEFGYTLQCTVNILVNSLAQWGGKKKIFQYCLNPHFLKKSLYIRAIHKDIHENISLIHYCKTMYYYRMTSPSTSTTSGTSTRCIPLFKVDWSREDEATGSTDSQCSSQL